MTNTELIALLQKLPGNLPVDIALKRMVCSVEVKSVVEFDNVIVLTD